MEQAIGKAHELMGILYEKNRVKISEYTKSFVVKAKYQAYMNQLEVETNEIIEAANLKDSLCYQDCDKMKKVAEKWDKLCIETLFFDEVEKVNEIRETVEAIRKTLKKSDDASLYKEKEKDLKAVTYEILCKAEEAQTFSLWKELGEVAKEWSALEDALQEKIIAEDSHLDVIDISGIMN